MCTLKKLTFYSDHEQTINGHEFVDRITAATGLVFESVNHNGSIVFVDPAFTDNFIKYTVSKTNHIYRCFNKKFVSIGRPYTQGNFTNPRLTQYTQTQLEILYATDRHNNPENYTDEFKSWPELIDLYKFNIIPLFIRLVSKYRTIVPEKNRSYYFDKNLFFDPHFKHIN